MASHSQFLAECLCGHPLATPDRSSQCPKCHRLIEFEWSNEPQVGVNHSIISQTILSRSQPFVCQFLSGSRQEFTGGGFRVAPGRRANRKVALMSGWLTTH
jgi:hypothetical protein